jgi:hypothetical protein
LGSGLLSDAEKAKLQSMISHKDPLLIAAVQATSDQSKMSDSILKLVRYDSSTGGGLLSSQLDDAFASLDKVSKKTLKSSLPQMTKLLEKLKKKPDDRKTKQLRMDNIIIKKYVLGVEGGLKVMEAAGFVEKDIKGKQYLCVEKPDTESLQIIIDRLKARAEQLKQDLAKGEGKRSKCLGGCGFFGSEATEGMCSQCYNKKHFGTPGDEQKEPPKKCVGGCGFYGLKRNNGYCTVCYKKDAGNRKKKARGRWKVAFNVVRGCRRFRLATKPVQKNLNRCWECNKKIGTSGIECRCGYVFCGTHRYADAHRCTYDYRKLQRKNLEKQNPLLQRQKFQRIQSDDHAE